MAVPGPDASKTAGDRAGKTEPAAEEGLKSPQHPGSGPYAEAGRASPAFEEGAILVDHGWKSSSYRTASSVMAQGAPGSACSRQQRIMDETYSALHYPALLRQLTAHLSPEEYHRFTADELARMGVIVVDDPDPG